MSTKITISNTNLNCDNVLDKLQKLGYTHVNIIKGRSLVDGNIENSCELTFPISFSHSKEDVNNLWNVLKNNYKLTCCHLNISGSYAGCILDWLSESLCK